MIQTFHGISNILWNLKYFFTIKEIYGVLRNFKEFLEHINPNQGGLFGPSIEWGGVESTHQTL